jgi:hypothetical protein
MSKWYAVKKGRIPGIYLSWVDCQKQTKGFSGTIFKSFSDRQEALNYFYDGKVPENMQERVPLLTSDAHKYNVPINLGIQLPTIKPDHRRERTDHLEMIHDEKEIEDREEYSYGSFTPPRLLEKTDYANVDRRILDTNKYLLIVYTDGSKRPSVNHRGSGAYCRFQHRDYCMSLPFDDNLARKYEFSPDEIEKLSSPTLEYLAFSEVLWRLISIKLPEENGIVKLINPRLKIIFVVDYIGVKCFTEGAWVAKKSHIIKIQSTCITIVKFLKERGIDVHIEHCSGHNKILGNELSDIAAKNTNFYDNIPELVEAMSKAFLNWT